MFEVKTKQLQCTILWKLLCQVHHALSYHRERVKTFHSSSTWRSYGRNIHHVHTIIRRLVPRLSIERQPRDSYTRTSSSGRRRLASVCRSLLLSAVRSWLPAQVVDLCAEECVHLGKQFCDSGYEMGWGFWRRSSDGTPQRWCLQDYPRNEVIGDTFLTPLCFCCSLVESSIPKHNLKSQKPEIV